MSPSSRFVTLLRGRGGLALWLLVMVALLLIVGVAGVLLGGPADMSAPLRPPTPPIKVVTDYQNDNENCGGKGWRCPLGASCQHGVCIGREVSATQA